MRQRRQPASAVWPIQCVGTQALQLRPNGCGMQRGGSCGRTARKWWGCHSLDLHRQRIWAPHWCPPSRAAGQRLDGLRLHASLPPGSPSVRTQQPQQVCPSQQPVANSCAQQTAASDMAQAQHTLSAVVLLLEFAGWQRKCSCCVCCAASAAAASCTSSAAQLEAAAHEPLSCGSDLSGKAGSLRLPDPSA